MLRWIRRHGETVVVAGVTALVVSGAPALGHVTKKLGHIVKHLNPLFVNVGEKASDSDLLDGKDATAFLGAGAKAADADRLDGMDSSAFLAANGKAADSELLDGRDSSEFLGVTDTAADSELLDGLNSTAFQRSYVTTVVVSPVGSQFQNGTALVNALAGITDASSGKPYLLKIEPGIYNLGSASLQLKNHVDVEGSGQETTVIRRTGGTTISSATLVFPTGSPSVHVRSLRIESSGGDFAVGVTIQHFTKLQDVDIGVSGCAVACVGVHSTSGIPHLRDVTVLANAEAASADAIALRSDGLTLIVGGSFFGSSLDGDGYGVLASGASASVTVLHSVVIGAPTDGVAAIDGGSAQVAGSEIGNGVAGPVTCAGVWDSVYTFFASTCPT